VFCNEDGGPLDEDNLRHRVFYRVLAKAGLRRVRFHDLRYLRHPPDCSGGIPSLHPDQLGHASIQLTVDTYGHLIPGANRQAVDRLDDATFRNPAATGNEEGVTAYAVTPL